MVKPAALLVVLSAAVLLAGGCPRPVADAAAPSADVATQALKGGARGAIEPGAQAPVVDADAAEGVFTIGRAKVPAGFPFTLAPGLELTSSSVTTAAPDARRYQLFGSTPSTPDEVVAHFERQLEAKGLDGERASSTIHERTTVSLRAEREDLAVRVIAARAAEAAFTTVRVSVTTTGDER